MPNYEVIVNLYVEANNHLAAEDYVMEVLDAESFQSYKIDKVEEVE